MVATSHFKPFDFGFIYIFFEIIHIKHRGFGTCSPHNNNFMPQKLSFSNPNVQAKIFYYPFASSFFLKE